MSLFKLNENKKKKSKINFNIAIMLVSLSFVNNMDLKWCKYIQVVYASKYDEYIVISNNINLYPMLRGPPLLFIIPFSL